MKAGKELLVKDNIILKLTAECRDRFRQWDDLLINDQEHSWSVRRNVGGMIALLHDGNYTYPHRFSLKKERQRETNL